nr:hypothetical protein [uncultured bacterium]
MRMVVGLIAVMLLLLESGGLAKPFSTTNARVDFDTQLKPIFQSKCMPCHFSGGKVYDRLPFDKPETIKKLGTRLFTRIKDDHDRQLIEAFLAQPEK